MVNQDGPGLTKQDIPTAETLHFLLRKQLNGGIYKHHIETNIYTSDYYRWLNVMVMENQYPEVMFESNLSLTIRPGNAFSSLEHHLVRSDAYSSFSSIYPLILPL